MACTYATWFGARMVCSGPCSWIAGREFLVIARLSHYPQKEV